MSGNGGMTTDQRAALVHLLASTWFFLGFGTGFVVVVLAPSINFAYLGLIVGPAVVAIAVLNGEFGYGGRFMARDVWEKSLSALGLGRRLAAARFALPLYAFLAGSVMIVVLRAPRSQHLNPASRPPPGCALACKGRRAVGSSVGAHTETDGYRAAPAVSETAVQRTG
jgi:hypothetical protein